MTISIHRWLLPVMFALLALMLSMHQAGAAVHVAEHGIGAVAVGSDRHDTPDPFHATTCCTIAFGVAAPDVVLAFSPASTIRFAVDPGRTNGYSYPRSKHFRPPRLV